MNIQVHTRYVNTSQEDEEVDKHVKNHLHVSCSKECTVSVWAIGHII